MSVGKTASVLNEANLEPVLAVPPAYTNKAFNILRDAGCVAMRWHTEGRYGSRTHVIFEYDLAELGIDRKYVRADSDEIDGSGDQASHSRTSAGNSKRMGLPLTSAGGALVREVLDYLSTDPHLSPAALSDLGDGNRAVNPAQDVTANSPATQTLLELLQLPGVKLLRNPITPDTNIPKDESTHAAHNAFDAHIVDVALSKIQVYNKAQPTKSHVTEEAGKSVCKSATANYTPGSSGYSKIAECNEHTNGLGEGEPKHPAFTFVELFAGIGGFGVALEALGGRCVFASELLPCCQRTYERNLCTDLLADKSVAGDIYEVPDEVIPSHDILVGGFPCQTFSGLGEQNGIADDSGRGMLYTQIVRVLKAKQPQAFLLENVPGLLKCDEGDALETIIGELSSAGYEVSHEVVNARCLTAQSRKRLYIVGLRRDLQSSPEHSSPFSFPFIPDLGLRAIDVLQTDLEIQQSSPDADVDPEGFYRLTDAQLQQLTNARKWKPSKLAWPDKTLDTLNSHYGVSVGKGESQLVPSPAPHNPRRLTPRECARVMGFPNSYILLQRDPESKQGREAYLKEQYRMLGNAVCPPIIAALAGSVLARCDDIGGDSDRNYWASAGVEVAVALALGAVSRNRLDRNLQRLQNTCVVRIVN